MGSFRNFFEDFGTFRAVAKNVLRGVLTHEGGVVNLVFDSEDQDMNIIPNVVTTPGYALPAGFKTAVQAACNFYDQLFSNPVNLNITFTYAPVSGGSAQNVAAGGYLDFANVQADLLAVANSTTGSVDQKA